MGHESRVRDTMGEILDARGRPLRKGDEIIVNFQGPTFLRVQDIGPVLDPAAPPGLLMIQVGASFRFTAMAEQRNVEFIRVQTAAEIRAAEQGSAEGGPTLVLPESGGVS